jgi:hypothetical protein
MSSRKYQPLSLGLKRLRISVGVKAQLSLGKVRNLKRETVHLRDKCLRHKPCTRGTLNR